jgi:hypothetical protein
MPGDAESSSASTVRSAELRADPHYDCADAERRHGIGGH